VLLAVTASVCGPCYHEGCLCDKDRICDVCYDYSLTAFGPGLHSQGCSGGGGPGPEGCWWASDRWTA
jgi:hypothetical protein